MSVLYDEITKKYQKSISENNKDRLLYDEIILELDEYKLYKHQTYNAKLNDSEVIMILNRNKERSSSIIKMNRSSQLASTDANIAKEESKLILIDDLLEYSTKPKESSDNINDEDSI